MKCGAMGVDRLAPLDTSRLPGQALDELAALLNVCEARQVWPHQLLLTIGTLPPKKHKGDRVIGLLPHIARLWSAARERHVRTWTDQCEAHWDATRRSARLSCARSTRSWRCD
eukprot:597312-Pyramimonas_sp.AAC.1